MIDVQPKQPKFWPSGLHETFSARLDSVDVADYAPREAREVCAALRRHPGRQVFERREIDGTSVAGLDDTMRAAAPPTMDQVA